MLRMFILLAWIPFLWQPVWGQSPGVGVDKSTVKKPNGSTRSNQAGDTDQHGTKEFPFVVDTKGHEQSDAERAQSDAKEQRATEVERWTLYFAQLSAWATVALVFIGFGGVIAAIVTLRAIKEQADLQERAIRPWVGTDFIEDGSLILDIEQMSATIATNIQLKNTGPSIALEGIMVPFLISSRADELQKGIKVAWRMTEEVLKNRNSTLWETGFVLHPTRSHQHKSSIGFSGTWPPIGEFQHGLWFVIVCVIYSDQFGKEHRTQDCFRIMATDAHSVKFEVVPAHQKAT